MKLPEKGGEAMLFKRIRRTKLKFPPIANKQFEKIFKEIAELTDCSINTALGRMRYALLNLRRIVEASDRNDLASLKYGN